MSLMYERAVDCITKHPSDRKDEDIRSLIPWFSKKSRVLDSVNNEILYDIIRNCDYTTKKKEEIIIRQGDIGDCFYIVLHGSVSIYVITDTETQSVPDLDPNQPLDKTLFGNYIRSIDAGGSFGELALINKDCIRNASIIAEGCSCRDGHNLTELLVINRDLFNRSIKSIEEAELRKRQEIVNNNQLFDHWKPTLKRQAAMSLQHSVYLFDREIVRQGDRFNGLVFIGSGQVKYVMDVTQHEQQYPSLDMKEFSNPDGLKVFNELMDVEREAEKITQAITRHVHVGRSNGTPTIYEEGFGRQSNVSRRGATSRVSAAPETEDRNVRRNTLSRGDSDRNGGREGDRRFTFSITGKTKQQEEREEADMRLEANIRSHIKTSLRNRNELANMNEEIEGLKSARNGPGSSKSSRSFQLSKRPIDFLIVSAPETVGELEAALALQSYAASVICTETTHAYWLAYKDYDRLVKQRNEPSLKVLKDNVDERMHRQLERMNEANLVPLVCAIVQKIEGEKKRRRNGATARRGSLFT